MTRRLWRSFDWVLLVTALLLIGIGIAMIRRVGDHLRHCTVHCQIMTMGD